VKLNMRYSWRHVPIEIEIEGASLTPDMIPNVLGSILEQLNSWIDAVMFKSHDGISGMPAQMDTPQLAPQPHSQSSQETQPI
jgi:hypothetical protein